MKRKVKLNSPVLFAICALMLIAYTTIVTLIHGGIYDLFMGTVLTELFLTVTYTFLLTIYKYKKVSVIKNAFSFCIFLLTFSIQIASAISYPFQAYRSGWSAEQVSVRQNKFLVQSLIFVAIFLINSCFMKKENFIQKKIKTMIYIPIFINSIIGMYFLATPGKTAAIKGVMIGLPLMAWMVFSFSSYHFFYQYAMQNVIKKSRRVFLFSLMVGSSVMIFLGYVHRHEYGIPAFLIIACQMWIFFEPHRLIETKKQKFLFYGTNIIIILVGAVITFLSYLVYRSAYNTEISKAVIPQNSIEEYVSSLSLIHNLGSKVARFLLDTGTEFIRTAGIHGSSKYIYNFAASNDFALALHIHNFGILWLIIISELLIITTISGCIFLLKNRERTIFDTAKSLSFFCIIVLMVYPLLSNVGVAPIIGVSAYAAGYSIMHSILSALLLSFVLYERG